MAWNQLIQPNRTIKGQVGMCLMYVRQVYGRPAVEPTAKQGWDRAQYKHADANHPRNVSMPIWWNWTEPSDGVNYGHVVWFDHTDGTYTSSPFATKTGWFITKSIDAITNELRKYGATSFLGWTEDVSGGRVISETADVILATDAEIKQAYLDILERTADDGGVANLRGRTLDFVRADLNASAEKKTLEANKLSAAKAASAAAAAAATEAKRIADEHRLAAEKAAKAAADAAIEAAKEAKKSYTEIDRVRDNETNTLVKLLVSIANDSKASIGWIVALLKKIFNQ